MATIRATEIKKGTAVVLDGELFLVVKREHVTPGKGQAVHHVQLRNMRTGMQKKLRLSTSESVEVAYLDTKQCQYLYKDASGYVFMDEKSYDQFHLSEEVIGELMHFIKENASVNVTFHEERPITVDLPAAVVLAVVEAEQAIKGDTATNVTKNAKVETGLAVKVPMHIKIGDKIKVSTEDQSFLGRVNE